LLAAEDARGTGPEGLGPLLASLDGGDSLLRRVAVRGLGRFQRPELGRLLLRSLGDHLPSVRAGQPSAIARRCGGAARRAGSGQHPAEHHGGRGAPWPARSPGSPTRWRTRWASRSVGCRSRQRRCPRGRGRDQARLARTDAGLVHGLYILARARKATGNLTTESIALLRRAAVEAPDTPVRRLALRTGVASADGLDSATAVRAVRDREPYVVLTAIDSLGSGCADPAPPSPRSGAWPPP
jgi:hypothetical protein